jgi:hypothetical protein
MNQRAHRIPSLLMVALATSLVALLVYCSHDKGVSSNPIPPLKIELSSSTDTIVNYDSSTIQIKGSISGGPRDFAGVALRINGTDATLSLTATGVFAVTIPLDFSASDTFRIITAASIPADTAADTIRVIRGPEHIPPRLVMFLNATMPDARQEYAAGSIAATVPVTLVFSEPILAASAGTGTTGVVVLKNGIREGIPGFFDTVVVNKSWLNGGSVLSLSAAGGFAADMSYKVIIPESITDLKGNHLQNPCTGRFSTVSFDHLEPFSIVSATVKNGDTIQPGQTIAFKFSRPVDSASLASRFSTAPGIAVKPVIEGSQVTVGNTAAMQRGAAYVFTIAKGVRDAWKIDTLAATYVCTLTVSPLSPLEKTEGFAGKAVFFAGEFMEAYANRSTAGMGEMVTQEFNAVVINGKDTLRFPFSQYLSWLAKDPAWADLFGTTIRFEVQSVKLSGSGTDSSAVVTFAVRGDVSQKERELSSMRLQVVQKGAGLGIRQVVEIKLWSGDPGIFVSDSVDTSAYGPQDPVASVPGINLVLPAQNAAGVKAPVTVSWEAPPGISGAFSYILVVSDAASGGSSGMAVAASGTSVTIESDGTVTGGKVLDSLTSGGLPGNVPFFNKPMTSLLQNTVYAWKVIAVFGNGVPPIDGSSVLASSDFGNRHGFGIFTTGTAAPVIVVDPGSQTGATGPTIDNDPLIIKAKLGEYLNDSTLPSSMILADLIRAVCNSRIVDVLGDDVIDPVLNIRIKSPEVRIDEARGRLIITGTTEGFGKAEFVALKGKNCLWAFGAELPAGFKLSQLEPDLGIFDPFPLPNAGLVMCSFATSSEEIFSTLRIAGANQKLQSGFWFISDYDISGTPLGSMLKLNSVVLSGRLPYWILGLKLEASVNTNIELFPGATFSKLTLRLKPEYISTPEGGKKPEGKPIGVSQTLLGTILADVTPSDRLEFIGSLYTQVQGYSVSGTMLGEWHNPFGARGVVIDSVALEVGKAWANPLPTVGVAGKLLIGSVSGKAAVKYDAIDVKKCILAATVNRLNVLDITENLMDASVGTSPGLSKVIPGIYIDSVDLYAALMPTQIGEIYYDPGLKISGNMDFLGLTSRVRGGIEWIGFTLEGSMEPVNLAGGLFTIGAASDTLPGPTVHLTLAAAKHEFFIDGLLGVLGMTGKGKLNIADNGASCTMTGSLFGLFAADATLTAPLGNLKSSDFAVAASMKNDLFTYLQDHGAAYIDDYVKTSNAGLASAQQDVKDAEAKVASINGSISSRRAAILAQRAAASAALAKAQKEFDDAQASVNSLQKTVDAQRAIVNAEHQAAISKLSSAQASVNSLQTQINDMQAKIDDANSKISYYKNKEECTNGQDCVDVPYWYPCPTWSKPWKQCTGTKQVCNPITICIPGPVAHATDITYWGTQLTAFEAAKATLVASKTTADAALSAAKYTVDHLAPVDLDPRVAGPLASLNAAKLALTAASKVLDGAKAAIDNTPVDLDPELAAFYVALKVAQAALEAANLALEAAKYAVAGTAIVADFITQYGLGNLVDVRSASFTGDLAAVSGGKVTMSTQVSYMGAGPVNVSFAFDFYDMGATIKNFAEELLKLK